MGEDRNNCRESAVLYQHWGLALTYLRNQAVARECANRRLHGILVAERIDDAVVRGANTRNSLTVMQYRHEPDGRLVLDPVAGPDVLRHFLGA
jgi:hypothetical protein